MTLYTKTIACAHCGAECSKKSGRQRYCEACRPAMIVEKQRRLARAAGKRRTELARANYRKPCKMCGSGFYPWGNQLFCDPCQPIARREYHREHARRTYVPRQRVFKVISCERCGGETPKTSTRKIFCGTCAPTVRREAIRKWADQNPLAVSAKAARYQDRHGERIAERKRERRQTDGKFCLDGRMRHAIRRSLCGEKRSRAWEQLVGYSLGTLAAHLERQFLPGMDWTNMPRWHVDHIRPLAAFRYESAEHPEFQQAWALTNLRPLWAELNLAKHARREFLI